MKFEIEVDLPDQDPDYVGNVILDALEDYEDFRSMIEQGPGAFVLRKVTSRSEVP